MDAIYARQSVEKLDSLSIEAQIDLCRKLSSGEVLVFEDRGFSGKNTNRPGFQSLMEGVQNGTIQRIFVYRLDRFSRSIADFGRVWEVLEKYSVAFVSVTEQFDTGSLIPHGARHAEYLHRIRPAGAGDDCTAGEG